MQRRVIQLLTNRPHANITTDQHEQADANLSRSLSLPPPLYFWLRGPGARQANDRSYPLDPASPYDLFEPGVIGMLAHNIATTSRGWEDTEGEQKNADHGRNAGASSQLPPPLPPFPYLNPYMIESTAILLPSQSPSSPPSIISSFFSSLFSPSSSASSASSSSFISLLDSPSTCGVGNALGVPNTASAAYQRAVRRSQNLNQSLAAASSSSHASCSSDSVLDSSHSSLSSLVGSWPSSRILGFLHAHDILSSLASAFTAEGARTCFAGPWPDVQVNQGGGDRLRAVKASLDQSRMPLPFLLPWPMPLDGRADQRPPPGTVIRNATTDGQDENSSLSVVPPRLHIDEPPPDGLEAPGWLNDSDDEWKGWMREMGKEPRSAPFYPSSLLSIPSESSQARAEREVGLDDAPTYLSYDGLLGDRCNIAALSSIARGCPWPLGFNGPREYLEGAGFSYRVNGEVMVVAQRVAAMMGVSGCEMQGQATAGTPPVSPLSPLSSPVRVNQYFAGQRSTDEWSRMIVGSDGRPLSPALLNQLSVSLPHGMIVQLAVPCNPYPCLYVAPLAPGWIGGFMCGSSEFELSMLMK